MADIDLKTETPDTSLPSTGFLFGADSQSAASPSVYSTQAVATTLLGSTSLTGATITADAPLLNMSQTWNASGVTFTGLRFNVTDTASAAGSMLMDLQVGGSSAFNVSKGGSLKLGLNASGTNVAGSNVTIAGSQGTGTGAGGSIIFQVAPAGSSGTAQNALADAMTIAGDRTVSLAGLLRGASQFYPAIDLGGPAGGNPAGMAFYFGSSSFNPGSVLGAFLANDYGGTIAGLYVCDTFGFATRSSRTAANTPDIRLYRDAAGTLALRNGTNAQTFNIYNTYTSATSFERFRIVAQSANSVLVGTEKGSGGGSARALAFQTDGTTRLTIETNGDLTIADAENVILGTTTGSKIGTATSQKIGFWNATPVVQPSAVADATDAATVITQLNALLSRMRNLGLIAT